MMHQRGKPGTDVARLEDYIRAVQLRKPLVLAIIVLAGLSAFLYASSRQSNYTATASVLVRSTPVGARVPGQFEPPNLVREQEVLQSNAVATAVSQRLSTGGPHSELAGLSVDFLPDSDVLYVHHMSVDGERSAAVANAFAEEYASLREAEAVVYYSSLQQSTIGNKDALTEAIEQAYAEREALRTERATIVGNGGDVTDIDAAIAALGANAWNLSSQLASAEAELRDLKKQDDARLPAAEVLKPALVPRNPNGVGLPYLVAAGLALGAIAGMVVAFILERLDTTAREDEDVALALGGTVLGSVPTLGIGLRGPASLVMLSTGGSARVHAAREAYRRLRSSVQFLNASNGVSSILITSSTPSEGKSLTSANVSIALAQNGSRVVLVNADMRRPTLETLFGIEAGRPGLSEYLSHTDDLNAERAPGIDNLWIIRSGRSVGNPGELLDSDRFEQMLKELDREGVDFVVIDTPPLLSTADAVSAARFVDGVIVVVDTERTDTSDLLRVRADLARSGSKILGAVMNRTKFKRRGLLRRRDRYVY